MATEQVDFLPAYGDAGLVFALPKAARLAARVDGTPAFFLEFFSDRNDPDVDTSLYAMLELGLASCLDLAQAHAALVAEHEGARLLPLTFTTGTWCHLELGGSVASLPFAWEDAHRATLNARLPLTTARLMYAAMASGSTAIVRAAIECEVAAVLPRHPAKVGFDARVLVPALSAALDRDGQGMPFQDLVDYLDKPVPGLLEIDGDAGTAPGLALAGRLRQAFGRFAPCVRVGDGPRIRLDAPAGAARMAWDLRTPSMCGVPAFLRCDPFDVLRGDTARSRLTAFTPVPRLPDALRTRQVTVSSGLPDSFRNCVDISVNLCVDGQYSRSGNTTSCARTLYPAVSRSITVDLAYAKTTGPKPCRAQVTVVGDAAVAEGPWFDVADDYLFIDTSLLPLQALTLRATDALLGQAVLSFSLAHAAGGGAPVTGRLDKANPAATLLVDTVAPATRLQVTAHSLADPGQAISLDLPYGSATLDLAAFPGYGPHTVPVMVSFHEGTDRARLAFQAESGDAEPVVLVFSPDAPQTSWSYFCTDIFKSRYRFRTHGSDAATAAPWSPWRAPEQALAIGMYADGARQDS